MATQEVKRARITAIVFAALIILTLVSFVYAFIQQSEAKQQKFLATQSAMEANQQLGRYDAMSQMAHTQIESLEKEASNLRAELLAAQEELKKCKGR